MSDADADADCDTVTGARGSAIGAAVVRLSIAVAILMICGVSSVAHAQGVARNPLPPDSLVRAPGGVDMRSGRMTYDAEDLSIGDPARGGISFRRITINTRPTALGNDSYQTGTLGQFSDNWDIVLSQISRGAGNGYDISIGGGGVATNFYSSDRTSFTSQSADYAELSSTIVGGNATYVLKTKDGRRVTFAPVPTGTVRATAVQLSQADGVVYTMTYATGRRRVQSNAGYALLLESGSVGVTKACVLNLAVQTLPAGDTCPAGVPTTSYGYNGKWVSSITARDNSLWSITNTYANDTTPFDMAFYAPGASSPYITNHFVNVAFHRVVGSQDFADGRHYDYQWQEVEYGETDTSPPRYDVVGEGYTLNGTDHTGVFFSAYPSIPPYAPVFSTGPAAVTDPIGRTTSFNYCVSCIPVQLNSMTRPGGVIEEYTYGAARNITRIKRKPGSATPALVPTQTDYTYDCTTLVFCAKPTSVTDAAGNVTVNVYDPVHGGLLRTTGPAVGGVTPQVRYGYVQRSAWIRSGSGYGQATPPIWLPATESSCRVGAPAGSGTGCALAGDEVVTTYEYGSDAGPNNLLLRGKAVSADGVTLRTCYGYDATGNRISETSPRAGLAVCP